jgi:hypothetical protein
MKVTKKEEEDMKRNRLLDKRITKKVRKFILYIKEMFYINANSKNLTTMRKEKEGGVLISVIYFNKDNDVVHAYRQDCDNIIEAIHTLYTYSEPLFIFLKDDCSKYYYELFDNITNKENLFNITKVEFSLEFRKTYSI